MTSTQTKETALGIGLRPKHYEHFLDQPPTAVSWVEVVSENFMDWKGLRTPAARQKLEKVRRHLPVALHGVSLNLGSTTGVCTDYLASLHDLVTEIDPSFVSQHLCWSGINGYNSHDLLPLPYTQEALNVVVENILKTQDHLKRPLALENLSSYVEFKSSAMKEWEFLMQVHHHTGAKILLDLNNVYVSSVNHGFNPHDYLKAIPASAVAYLHVAGHTQKDGYLLDTHDAPVAQPVLELIMDYREKFKGIPLMLERDGNIPEWAEMESELHRIRHNLSTPISPQDFHA